MDFAALLKERPTQYGLRGDVYLWNVMEQALAGEDLPDSAEALRQRVEVLFHEFSGAPVDTPEPFFVKKYSHGGMSSGYVDPRWWRNKAIPLLIERWTGRAES